MLASVAAAPSAGCVLITGPSGVPGGGHSEWCNGNASCDGFTTALPPDTYSPAGSPAVDTDMAAANEADGGPTYASVTSRSYHPGGVNALFAGGSVHFIKNSINYQTCARTGNDRHRGGDLLRQLLSFFNGLFNPDQRIAEAIGYGSHAICAELFNAQIVS